jgi:hypothetical protein
MTTIATEFGGTVPHSLSEYYRGGGLVPNVPQNAAIPTSGQIAMGNFYGSSNRRAVALTIAANTNNYDVYTNRGPSYVPGISDITVTINPGVTVGSTTVPAYAMLVPNAFSPTDTVTIVNNGIVYSAGGPAGAGGPIAAPLTANPGGGGSPGGGALYVNRPVTVVNNGTIRAGGGGGGGGGAGVGFNPGLPKGNAGGSGGGGGGGAGFSGGGGGGAGAINPAAAPSPGQYTPGAPGSAGTPTAGGAFGIGGGPIASGPASGGAGRGGTGGGIGAAGASGLPGSASAPVPRIGSGGGGGAAGNYIVGNPFVTWPVTGTRQGNVA